MAAPGRIPPVEPAKQVARLKNSEMAATGRYRPEADLHQYLSSMICSLLAAGCWLLAAYGVVTRPLPTQISHSMDRFTFAYSANKFIVRSWA